MPHGHRSRSVVRRRSVSTKTLTNAERVAEPLPSIRQFYGREFESLWSGIPRKVTLSPLDEVELSALENHWKRFGSVVQSSRYAKQSRAPMASRAALFTKVMNDIRQAPTPWHAWVCVRRRVRREVLFARLLMRKRGGGGGSFRRFSLESFVRCR